MMYFEIFNKGKLIKRGKDTLSPLSFDNELMYVPSLDLSLPIDYLDYLDGHEEFKIHVNDKIFWGIVWDLEPNKMDETLTVSLRHVVSEWEYRQISVNHAMTDKKLNAVYMGDETEKDEDNDEEITASGFTIGKGKTLTNAQIISKARATAWVMSNGDPVSVTSVKIQKQNDDNKWEDADDMKDEGSYRVTFSTAKGTSVRVDVSVEDKYSPDYGTLTDPTIVDKLEDIYHNKNFAYPGWEIEFQDDSEDEMIEYVYSKQNKLEALTQTMELTEDLFWRVGFTGEKKIEIGRFGEKKPYIISAKPSGKTNIGLISEPVIDYDFENVVNVVTVYSDKSDSGMASLTLREVYNDADLVNRGLIDERIQKDEFPVVILRAGVNNEGSYSSYSTPLQPPSLAPSNELEFAIIDTESVALESGTIMEGSLAFNDLSPFEISGKKISDRKRIRAARTAYRAGIRYLKQMRRSYNVEIVVEEIPSDLNVGDRVRFIYDNRIWHLEACSSYWKKILSYDDWWYLSKISYDIDENGVETNTITLTKWLKTERETQ